jgi:hypothetical protein
MRHSRPLFTRTRHWRGGHERLYWESCCDRGAALGKMSDQGIDWSELIRRRPLNAANGTNRTKRASGVLARSRSVPDGPGEPGTSRGGGRQEMRWDAVGVGPHAHCAACMVERWSGSDAELRDSGVPGVRVGDRVLADRLGQIPGRWPMGKSAGADTRVPGGTGVRAPRMQGSGGGGEPHRVHAPRSAQVTWVPEFGHV